MAVKSVIRATAILAALALPSLGDRDNPATDFAASVEIPSASSPEAVAAGDVDGDGTTDLVFADGATGDIAVRRNQGAGTVFTSQTFKLANGDLPLDLALADMDGDQDLDLVVGAFDGVRVITNDGLTGGLLDFTQLDPVPADGFFPSSRIAVADYDGDQKADVVSAGDHIDGQHPSGGHVALLRNTGGGVLTAAGLAILDALPRDVAAADFDGDGKAEILAGLDATRQLVLFRNPGDGTVDLGAARQTSMGSFGGVREIVVGDITRDGRPDVLIAHGDYFIDEYRSGFAVFFNTPGTPFSFTPNSSIDHSFVTAPFTTPIDGSCAIGDVDGDGFPEIVAISPLQAKARVLHFDPVSNDLVLGEIKSFDTAASPFHVMLAQLNLPPDTGPVPAGRDTKLDIVTLHRASPRGNALFNTTPGGGGGPGGSDLPPATNLTVTSKRFPDGSYQDGQAWTFTCTQTDATAGLAVRMQATETPADAASWQDLPFAPPMTRGKGKKVNTFTLKTNHVPSGDVWFRTVTSAPGEVDSPNTDATGPAAYRGPFEIAAPGAAVILTAVIAPASDPVDRRTSLVGDTVAFIYTLKNQGNAAATNVVVSQSVPNDVKFDTAPPVAGATFGFVTPKLKKGVVTKAGVVRWTIPTLAPGATMYLAFTACVRPGAPVVIASQAGLASSAAVNIVSPEGQTRLVVDNPLRMDVDVLDDPTPRGGDVVSYALRAENEGATTFTDCIAIDVLPRGTALEAAYFTDEFGDPVTPPVAAPGGRANPHYDAAKRKVTWYLGPLAGNATARMRLDVRLAYDLVPGRQINNTNWQLRGCPPCITGCDPLIEDSLPVATDDAHDVVTTLSASPPAGVPILRLDQYTGSPDVGATVTDGRYGALSTVAPGGEFIHKFLVKNTGTAIARNVVLSGNLANEATLVAGSVLTLDVGTLQVDTTVPHTITSGGTLAVDLGDVGPGAAFVVAYRGRMSTSAKLRSLVVFSGWNLATDGLSAAVFAGPTERRMFVANPFQPTVEVIASRSAVKEGDLVTYTALLSNRGTLPGTGAKITMTIPPGMTMADDPDVPGTASAVLLDRNGTVVNSVEPDPKFKGVFFSITSFPAAERYTDADGDGVYDPGESFTDTIANGAYDDGTNVGRVRLTLRLVKAPAGSTLQSVATFTGVSANSAKSSTETSTFTQSTTVERSDRTEVVMAKLAPMLVRARLEFAYTVIVANTGSVEARNVVASMTAPPQTHATPAQSPVFGTDGDVKGDTATWTFGTLAPGEVRIRQFQVKIDNDVSGCAIVDNSCFVQSDNAPAICAGPTSSLLLFDNSDFSGYRWPAAHCFLQSRGMNLDGASNPVLDAAITGLEPTGFTASVGGAGILQFTNGTFAIPLGGGQMVAAGAGNLVGNDGGTLVPIDGGSLVAAGAGNLITLKGVAGFGDLKGAELIPRLAELVAAGAGNLLNGGGTNLVGNDGASLVGNDGSTIQATIAAIRAPGTLVAAGAGNLVAAGAGNLVAAGAGNLVGNDGASLVPKSGGWLVAAGGGNLVAAGAGNLVAAGAGNLVAAGAGNLGTGTK